MTLLYILGILLFSTLAGKNFSSQLKAHRHLKDVRAQLELETITSKEYCALIDMKDKLVNERGVYGFWFIISTSITFSLAYELLEIVFRG